jgi:Tfp pilus assembly protein PilN
MTNINLLQSAQGKDNANNKKFRMEKALIIPLVILVAVFSIFGAAESYSYYLSKKKANLDNETKVLSNLSGKNVDRIVDFQERIDMAAKDASSKADYNAYLKDLENSVVSGAIVTSLTYGSGGIEVEINADNFKTVARQMLSFRNSNYFKNLTIDKTSRNKDGRIQFSLKGNISS